ncbi:ATP synthase F(0) complex subunit j, mitochondrial [Cottoperca gobio]|uniref:ATP synthase F(0) complex subunit j, mitochondrial n=1 Tax=Cottoperca gobio TaxID=56716 RepID=A0A6J2P5T1_COTGO|nr:ATP synthase subunit ATP5MPL, mitochondrial-like [Cottoperca gobio]
MAGSAFASWWTRMSPYYTKVYQEVWVGMGLITLVSYKLAFGGKKAVDSKPAH